MRPRWRKDRVRERQHQDQCDSTLEVALRSESQCMVSKSLGKRLACLGGKCVQVGRALSRAIGLSPLSPQSR